MTTVTVINDDETTNETSEPYWAPLTTSNKTKDDIISNLLAEYEDEMMDLEAGENEESMSKMNETARSTTTPTTTYSDYDDDDENDDDDYNDNDSPFYYRRILPQDRHVIQALHEQWFPVSYQEEFYDHLVLEEMCHTGSPLYTNLLCQANTTDAAAEEDEILACLVGISLEWTKLNGPTRQYLLPDSPYGGKHKRVFYIMTLGTVEKVRKQGLATTMIEECIQRVVENDPGCGALYLHVITSNASAIRFYERLQFWRVQEIEDYYTIEGKKYNCYLYARYFHGNRGHLGPVKALTGWISSMWKKAFHPTRKRQNFKIARRDMTQNNGYKFRKGQGHGADEFS